METLKRDKCPLRNANSHTSGENESETLVEIFLSLAIEKTSEFRPLLIGSPPGRDKFRNSSIKAASKRSGIASNRYSFRTSETLQFHDAFRRIRTIHYRQLGNARLAVVNERNDQRKKRSCGPPVWPAPLGVGRGDNGRLRVTIRNRPILESRYRALP